MSAFLSSPRPMRKKARPPSTRAERTARGELLDEVADAGDRAGLQGREEGDGGEVGQEAAGAVGIAAVEVDGVGEGLERVEGEPEREDPIVAPRAGHHAHVPRADSSARFTATLIAMRMRRATVALRTHKSEADQEIDGRAGGNQGEVKEAVTRAEIVICQQDYGEADQARLGAAQ